MMRSRVLAWLGAREAGMLAALLIAAGVLWLFIELADEVIEGESASVDERLLLMLRSPADSSDPLGPAWVEELARDATGVGGAAFLTFLTLASVGFLVLQRKGHLAAYLLTAVAGGTLVSTLLKLGFDRPRPDLASAQTNMRIRIYLIGLATFLAIAVGVSRVYLGVHWPTDVLAGWTAGAIWTLLCWALAERLRRRGVVE